MNSVNRNSNAIVCSSQKQIDGGVGSPVFFYSTERMINVLKEIPNIDFEASTSLTDFYKGLGWNPQESFLNPTKVVVNEQDGKKMLEKFLSSTSGTREEMMALWLNYGPKMQESVPKGKVLLADGWLKNN